MTQKDFFSLSNYRYELPSELIAQYPASPRDSSRLMIINRKTGNITEASFSHLIDFLHSDDSLVFNDTKVIPARLIGKRVNGGNAEILLVRRLAAHTWEVLARPGKKLKEGSDVYFSERLSCRILQTLPDGNKIVHFTYQGNFEDVLLQHGQLPLPHYIREGNQSEIDKERYQTVYAVHAGAIAAPTAGLHFTREMLSQFDTKGIKQTKVTLHVGIGTFKPVQTEDIRQHVMHTEQAIITPEAAYELNKTHQMGLQICVGTTCCRTLETVASPDGMITPGEYATNIFIYPSYKFKFVKSLLTNFHLPETSLLMLVCAFGGYELIMEAYAKAVKDRFRFYSYGDAMLII